MNFSNILSPLKIFSSFFLIFGIVTPSLAELQYVYPDEFVCRQVDGVFSTFAVRGSREFTIIKWKSTEWQDYSPENRCMAVSERLTQAAQDRSLQYLTHGWMNGQPVICTTSNEAGECDRLIFTLLHREASIAPEILRDLNDIGSARATQPLYRGENNSSEVVTETASGQVSVNMEVLFVNLFGEE